MKRTQAGVCAIHSMLIAMLTLSVTTLAQAAEPSQASSHSSRCESAYRMKPVPPKQLQAIVESHGQWLEQREKPEHRRADSCSSRLTSRETHRGQP